MPMTIGYMSNSRFTHALRLGAALVVAAMPFTAHAQTPVFSVVSDTATRQLITLRDGSTIIGRITHNWGDSARVESTAGTFVVRLASVRAVQFVRASSIHDGVYWPDDPNATRLFFSPTGRMLKKGEGYVANHWVLFLDGYVGLSDRFTLGGTMTLFPTSNFLKDNAYFVSPKLGIAQGERFNAAVGAWIGGAPFSSEAGAVNTFGIAYGVATWGGLDGAFTLGTGYGVAEGKMARNPMLMVGGTRRISRRFAFVTENWIFPNATEHPLVTFGLRSIGNGVSWDLAGMTVLGSGGTYVVPWLGAAWKF